MELGFETDRLKTGTPARVDSRSVQFGGLERQPGDEDVRWFSFDPEARFSCCWPAPLRIAARVSLLMRNMGHMPSTRELLISSQLLGDALLQCS